MSLSIDKTIKSLDDLGELVLDVMALVKRGIGLGSLASLVEAVSDLRELSEDLPGALPELADLDASEAARIAAAAYSQLQKIVAAGL